MQILTVSGLQKTYTTRFGGSKVQAGCRIGKRAAVGCHDDLLLFCVAEKNELVLIHGQHLEPALDQRGRLPAQVDQPAVEFEQRPIPSRLVPIHA